MDELPKNLQKAIRNHNKKRLTEQRIKEIAYSELYKALVKPLEGYKQYSMSGAIQEWMHVVLKHCIKYRDTIKAKEIKNDITETKRANVLVKEHIKKYRGIIDDPLLAKMIRPKLSWMNGKVQGNPFHIKHINLYGDDVESTPVSAGITSNTISAILRDLYSLQKYIKNHKGSININKIISDCNFDIIDQAYLELLYFTPQYNYQGMIKNEIISDIQSLHEDFTKNEIKEISDNAAIALRRIFKTIESKRLIDDL